MGGQHAEFAEDEDPEDFWKLLLDVLKTMTEKDRRESIDAKLVKAFGRSRSDQELESFVWEEGKGCGGWVWGLGEYG